MMEQLNSKMNLKTEKDGMAKVANIITMVIYYLKGNIIREKDTEKEKNILLIENWNLKAHIQMDKD